MTLDMPRPVSVDLTERVACDRLRAIRAVILLAGSLRPRRLTRLTHRAIPELPVDDRRCILKIWQDQLANLLAARAGVGEHDEAAIDTRVLVNAGAPCPGTDVLAPAPRFDVERDPGEFRGTGGLLRDVAEAYDDDDHLLVATASRVAFDPLAALVARLLDHDADVRVLAHPDGSPMEVYVVRCAALRQIPRLGYVDFKEQALPRIVERHRVAVIRRPRALTPPVRTVGVYITALRWVLCRRLALGGLTRARWAPAFAITEPGATVDRGAMLHDSVVLAGGRVGAGATVVRSLVGPGAVVGAGESVVDRVVGHAEPNPGQSRRVPKGGPRAVPEDAA